jgi:zinc protease
MDLAARVLTDGLSSRLDKALVYDRQLASDVNGFTVTGEIAGVFVLVATARPGASLTEIERIIGEEIARLAKDGPTPAEVERAKTKQESEFISGLERIGGFGGKADVLNQYNTYLGDPGRVDEDLARYRAVSPDSMRRAVAGWLATPNHAIIRFHPEPSQRLTSAPALDRSKVPALGEDRPFTAPTVQTTRLSNGLEVLVVERHDLPKATVTLVTHAGAVADPPAKAGTAHLTIRTIDMGTKTRNALEIEDALGALGTTLTGTAGREGARLEFDVLSRNLSPALAIVADVVQNPTFPEEEVSREKKRQLDAIAQQDRNPNALVARIQPMLAFGASHPYGRPVQGLRSTVEAISRDDLVAFHAARWKPGSTAVIFVGDVTLAQATDLAKQHFGQWTGGAAEAVTIPPASPAQPGRIYLVDRPDSAQTFVAQWLPAPPRKSPDYDALSLVDAVWGGGGFGTRLNLNLREDKGYSYGVFSNFNPQSAGGTWVASGGVQTDKTAPSVAEFDKELKDLAGRRSIDVQELDHARTRRVRGYAQQFESLGRIAGEIANLWTLRLPMTELQREYDATTRVTIEPVLAATRKYVRPEMSAMLLVGDRAKIAGPVRDLKLGEIVVLDAEGRPAGTAQ